MLPARYRVTHAGTSENVHVIHYDKGPFLKSHYAQVVLIGILVPERVVTWPDWKLQPQRLILPSSHLRTQVHKHWLTNTLGRKHCLFDYV